MIRVAVVGAGIIGKRLVRALECHPELQLAGVAVRRANVFVTARSELPYFAADPDAAARLHGTGVTVRGGLSDLLASADVVIDCGPSRTGASRCATYRAAQVRAVYCGGERDADLGPLVHLAHNPRAAAGAAGVRLASCNVTALARLAAAVGPEDISELDATIVRCATDTDKARKGITNGALLGPRPSHHADDLMTLVPGLAARSTAMTVPMTAGHVIHARLRLRPRLPAASALGRLREVPRIHVRDADAPIDTAALKAGVSRQWHNRYELLVQPIAGRDTTRLDVWLSLDNEAITIPEALDVLQFVGDTGDTGALESVGASTDQLLGITGATFARHCAEVIR
jgi:glyceraldehyde-3-phosphate dehydrogenase (NAD(P))